VAYGRNFLWGGAFIQWHMVVICIWCVLFPTLCFQTKVLAKLVDIICIFFHTLSPFFISYCTEYKLSVLQVRISEENTLIATTQQFITAKIIGKALKQGSATHSSLSQRN